MKLTFGAPDSALTSFNTMVQQLDPANTQEIEAYRSWLDKRAAIDHAETRFLDHGKDLLTVSERRRSADAVGGVVSRPSGAIWLPPVLVLPLMVFAIVPGFLGRLVILSMTGAAVTKLISSTRELREAITPREWAGCFSM